MAKILIVGAGIAGHFAAMTLPAEPIKRLTGHEIHVIRKFSKLTRIPSLIHGGIGRAMAQAV